MILDCKKAENCFQDSQTYEYRIPLTAEDFLRILDSTWQTRCNYRLRRPVFISEKDGIHIKGILSGTILRISFPNKNYESVKKNFEDWLVTEFEKRQY